MPIIPLRQTVTVRKLISSSTDGWNESSFGEAIPYRVRASEKIEIVVNELGEEKKSTVKLLFDKLPDIAYTDEITFENELGVKIMRSPLTIRPIRMINGKPTLTAVYL